MANGKHLGGGGGGGGGILHAHALYSTPPILHIVIYPQVEWVHKRSETYLVCIHNNSNTRS